MSDNKSGGTNTGIINGATWAASGALSGSKMALDFDGSNDQVQFQGNSPAYNNTALTIEAWMKSTNAGENKELVSWGDASGSNIVEFKMDKGKLKFGINVSSAESVWGSQAINTGKWVHVAVVKDNSNITLYVNGVVGVHCKKTKTDDRMIKEFLLHKDNKYGNPPHIQAHLAAPTHGRPLRSQKSLHFAF